MPSRGPQTRHWCFTCNNYTDVQLSVLRHLAETPRVSYLVFGREVGQQGTPHLQGYIVFSQVQRFNQVREALPLGCHIEPKRGTAEQAAAYCKKDGDFEEHGTMPSTGTRGAFEHFVTWCKEQCEDGAPPPSERQIANAFPALYVRYRRNLLALAVNVCPPPVMQTGQPNEWQAEMIDVFDHDPDDRKILFVVDPVGGNGKTWLIRYLFSNRDDVQVLSSGKRDDIAHAVDVSKRLFLFSIPRGGMEFLQYQVLEMLKDRMVFSPKYNSQMKMFPTNVHVVVFSNELPKMEAMTADRYWIKEISNSIN